MALPPIPIEIVFLTLENVIMNHPKSVLALDNSLQVESEAKPSALFAGLS